MTTKIFIVAAERSGDDLGAGLISALKQHNSDIDVVGIGGDAMANAGVASQMDIDGLSILGFVEGLKHYPMILRKVRECCDKIMHSHADAVILIDSWGFMIRVASRLKRKGYTGKIIKYVAPQVWAMRAKRAKLLAQKVDLLLSIQPMDAPYFEPHGLETIYVGNPVFDTDYQAGQASTIKEKGGPVLSVWFGSRPSEIAQLSSDFVKTIKRLKSQQPTMFVVSAIARSVRREVELALKIEGISKEILIVDEERKLDVMAASDVALACSGTVTTQLASAGVPTIVAYRLNGLTYFVAKRLFKPNYISIVNIAADSSLMPEYVQNDVTPDALTEAVNAYLEDPDAKERASKQLLEQTHKMGARSFHKANEKAAIAVLATLKS